MMEKVSGFRVVGFVALIGFFLISTFVFSQAPIPTHGGRWVHDEAKLLSPGAVAELEAILKAERDSTSNQIAILIMPNLEGDEIDGYANRVFREWKLGDAKKDNGVLFLIALQEKQMRIEVGFGLEGALTDAMSSRINRNEVAPFFREGNYDAGVRAGTLAIIQVIKGEYVNEEPQGKRKKRSPLVTIIIIVIFLIIASRRNKRGGGGYWSSGGGYMGPMIGGSGFGGSSSSWSDFGGGGDSGGGGSSDSW